MASELQILGDILDVRGELDKSLEYRRRALAIAQKIAPLSLQTENHLASLGRLEAERGDPKRARLYFQESERILRARMGGAEESVYIYILQSLARIEAETGNLQQAEQYEQRALALSRRVQVPRGIAISLGHLGMLAFERKDLKAADSYLRESILQYDHMGIRDADFADKLYRLGEVLEQRGQQAEAEATYRKALALIRTLGPKSAKQAEVLAGLARLLLAEGQPAAAAESYQDALEAGEPDGPHWGWRRVAGWLSRQARKYLPRIRRPSCRRKEARISLPGGGAFARTDVVGKLKHGSRGYSPRC
jgi:tetratricopeptide (TPR) repeat protein